MAFWSGIKALHWSWAGKKMTMNQRNTIDLEQGWEFMQKGIMKLKSILEGLPEPQFSSEDYMMLYTYCFNTLYCNYMVFLCEFITPWSHSYIINYRTIYNMCTQKPPHDYSQQLYDKYRESFEEYITSTVRICLLLLAWGCKMCIIFLNVVVSTYCTLGSQILELLPEVNLDGCFTSVDLLLIRSLRITC